MREDGGRGREGGRGGRGGKPVAYRGLIPPEEADFPQQQCSTFGPSLWKKKQMCRKY